jgi:hypothetical protein
MQKNAAGSKGSVFFVSPYDALIGKARFDKLEQAFHSLLLVASIRDNFNVGAAHNAQGQNAQKAFGVDSALFFFHPDGRFIFIGFLDKESRGSGVQPDLILYGYFFYKHFKLS